MAGRDSVFVNARVRLPGTRGLRAVAGHLVEYIATRPGADRSATASDLRRADLAERMELAGYCAARPGSTALFDADGAVPVAEARRRLGAAEGAVSTWVVSVRRDEAAELGLSCKGEWQAYCRSHLAPALAEAMGVPESDVRWVAAVHLNSKASIHVHVLAFSASGSFDSLIPKPRLERARRGLVDAGLARAVAAEDAARDRARDAAVSAAGSLGVPAATLGLPEEGRVSYAHLRRWHPDAAARVDAALEAARAPGSPLSAAEAGHAEAVRRGAGLRGLPAGRAERLEREAASELRHREANALLRAAVPDRAPHAPRRAPRPAPRSGPGTRRRALLSLEAEAAACAPGEASAAALRRCPTFRRAAESCPGAALSAAGGAISASLSGGGRRPASDEAGTAAARAMARGLLAAAEAAGAMKATGRTARPPETERTVAR